MEPDRQLSRRELIRRVSALLGGFAFVGGSGLLDAAERASVPVDGAVGAFSADDVTFLDEIAETILPATKTPGAKAAKTGAFMALMVTDVYRPDQQRIFRAGMRRVDDAAKQAHAASFMAAAPEQRLALLTVLDHEQKRVMDDLDPDNTDQPPHFFRMMKELALLGYFTSEVGCVQALRYIEVPGRFEPSLPYRSGDPAWAERPY